MNEAPRPARPEVRLDPKLQAKLLDQMRAEQQASFRTLALRRYVLLPGVLGALVWSVFITLYGSPGPSIIGNILASTLLFYLFKHRARLGSVFGF
jgi:hypothetical protein